MPRNRRETKGLEPDFEEQFKKLVKTDAGKQMVLDAVFALCCCMDDMIQEENTYLTWGMSKDGTRMNITFHEGKVVYYANGQDLQSLLTEVVSL